MIDQFTNWYVQETVKYMPLVYFLKQKKIFKLQTKNREKSAIHIWEAQIWGPLRLEKKNVHKHS